MTTAVQALYDSPTQALNNVSDISGLTDDLNISLADKENVSAAAMDASHEAEAKHTPTRKMSTRRDAKAATRAAAAKAHSSPLHMLNLSGSAPSYVFADSLSLSGLASAPGSYTGPGLQAPTAAPGASKVLTTIEQVMANMELQLQALEYRSTPVKAAAPPAAIVAPATPAAPVALGQTAEPAVQLQHQLDSAQAERSQREQELGALQARVAQLESDNGAQRETVLALTSQIAEKLEAIAALEETVARVSAELAARSFEARCAAEQERGRARMRRALRHAFEARGILPADAELAGIKADFAVMKRQYFFSTALAVKLNFSLLGQNVNGLDTQEMYEAVVAQAVPVSDWPAWIACAVEARLS